MVYAVLIPGFFRYFFFIPDIKKFNQRVSLLLRPAPDWRSTSELCILILYRWGSSRRDPWAEKALKRQWYQVLVSEETVEKGTYFGL
jgi:hypothetical protein